MSLSQHKMNLFNRIAQRSYSAQTNQLAGYLRQTIKATGPISVAAYMRQCLTNPEGGYYTTHRDPFGVQGDFITSPEISQMFGELVGVWVLTQWMAQGGPSKFRITEYGPGRGTLMEDLLRAARHFKEFKSALSDVQMVEASPTLRDAQAKTLGCTEIYDSKAISKKYGVPVHWNETTKDVTKDGIPEFIIAHEFFDALPVHQFENTDNGWREVMVDCENEDMNKFVKKLSTGSTAFEKIFKNTPRYNKLPVNSKVELCPEAWDIAAEMGDRVQNGGAALVVDYGSSTIPVESLRGIHQHKWVSPFENPGRYDLSVDVDFTAIKQAAMKDKKIDVYGPVMQGDWLHSLGIGARATQLADQTKDAEVKKRIEQAYNRLTEKSGGSMGKVYKAMSILPKGGSVPVGFGGSI